MRNDGIIIIVGALALAGLLFAVWLLGLVLGFTVGGLIHLLLLLAVLIAPIGIAAGVARIILGRDRGR